MSSLVPSENNTRSLSRRLSLLGVVLLCACRGSEPPVGTLTLKPEQIELGFSEMVTVNLSWQAVRPLEELTGQLRVLVHLLEQPGEVLRTFDHPFPQEWVAGSRLDYELKLHQSVLGPPLGPGSYWLTMGLYDEVGSRWPLEVEGSEVDQGEYAVAEVMVGSRSTAPMFRFSESWKPIEAGSDRQMLGRRWLTDHGSISVTEIAEAGVIWLVLSVPSVEPGVHRLVLDSGYETTRVLIHGSCVGGEIEITGEGPHELEIPLGDPEEATTLKEDGAGCDLVFEPNFHLVTPGTSDRRAILLETLAWGSTAR